MAGLQVAHLHRPDALDHPSPGGYDADRHDGAWLRQGLIQSTNTVQVWVDSAYSSAENEAWPKDHGMTSRIHRKKPRPYDAGTDQPGRASVAKSALRSKVERVFAHQKARTRLTIWTIGIARAEAITLANMAYNMTRWRWLHGRAAPA